MACATTCGGPCFSPRERCARVPSLRSRRPQAAVHRRGAAQRRQQRAPDRRRRAAGWRCAARRPSA
eukprot:4779098-Prymnesium_polylepis.2